MLLLLTVAVAALMGSAVATDKLSRAHCVVTKVRAQNTRKKKSERPTTRSQRLPPRTHAVPHPFPPPRVPFLTFAGPRRPGEP